jgi:hypothetical protein
VLCCAAAPAVIYLIIGCRRKNTVDRAVASRSKSSKRGERQPLPPAEDSKWRQMYSARMSDSMRRAEEATAKAQVQSRGPSFLEVKDQEFAQQAAMATDGQAKPSLSGKQSCECGGVRGIAACLCAGCDGWWLSLMSTAGRVLVC